MSKNNESFDEKDEVVELIPVEVKQEIEKGQCFLKKIVSVSFITEQDYKIGVDLCKEIKQLMNFLKEKKEEIYRPVKNDLDEINNAFYIIKELEDKEKVFKNGMGRFFQEKEQKRLAEQRRIEAEAAEVRRQQEERARKEAEKAAAYREQGRDKLADKAEARSEMAQTVAETVVAPIVENTAKAEGVSFTTVYQAEVTDKTAAIQQCLFNGILLPYVSIDLKGIERLAAAQKGALSIPGIRITESRRPNLKV